MAEVAKAKEALEAVEAAMVVMEVMEEGVEHLQDTLVEDSRYTTVPEPMFFSAT